MESILVANARILEKIVRHEEKLILAKNSFNVEGEQLHQLLEEFFFHVEVKLLENAEFGSRDTPNLLLNTRLAQKPIS